MVVAGLVHTPARPTQLESREGLRQGQLEILSALPIDPPSTLIQPERARRCRRITIFREPDDLAILHDEHMMIPVGINATALELQAALRLDRHPIAFNSPAAGSDHQRTGGIGSQAGQNLPVALLGHPAEVSPATLWNPPFHIVRKPLQHLLRLYGIHRIIPASVLKRRKEAAYNFFAGFLNGPGLLGFR